MRAAVVSAAGQKPVYGEFEEPVASSDEVVVQMGASALSQLARGRAEGRHYSSWKTYPFAAGVDGAGRRLDNGQRVYFFNPNAPFGAMAERALVSPTQCIALPDTLDDVTAAAIAIPGMSSWAALTERACFKKGETVLINGATGTSGRLAVQVARRLGAGKIIATGRSVQALASLDADIALTLGGEQASITREFEGCFRDGVDVVLDYLWGASARALLIAAAKASENRRALRFVQIGSMSGAEIALPAAVLRSTAITLLGSGIGSIALDGLMRSVGAVLDAAAEGALCVDTRAVPLARLSENWDDDGRRERTVFVMR